MFEKIKNMFGKSKINYFIICHDQNLILEFIKNEKFKSLPNYKFLFVGDSDCDSIADCSNVIICNNLDNNIEDKPLLCSFTGWYAVSKNNLSNSNYVCLLEHDVEIVDSFHENNIKRIEREEADIYGYLEQPLDDAFSRSTPWLEIYTNSKFEINVEDFLKAFAENETSWMSTTNFLLKRKVLCEFVDWFYKHSEKFSKDKLGSYMHERMMFVYCVLYAIKKQIISNVLLHHQKCSHGIKDAYEEGVSEEDKYNNYIDSLRDAAWVVEPEEDFDEDFYAKNNKDLHDWYLSFAKEHEISERKRLYHHYFLHGKKEKRPKNKLELVNQKKYAIMCSSGPVKKCKKILIKMPTLNRPNSLFKSLDSFYENKSGRFEVSFIISANSNDLETNNKSIREKIKKYEGVKIFFGNHKNKVESYNADIGNTYFDIIIAASDDMIVVEKDYDEIIIKNMEKYFPDTDGVLWFDTGDNDITDTLSIVGRKYYERFNYIYNNCYNGYYCDDEFTRVAFKLGRLRKINKKIIVHEIPHHLEMSNDDTYLKSLVHGTRDKAMYKIRKKIQFDVPSSKPLLNLNFNEKFFSENRNNDSRWSTPFTKYDDPITVPELYILEDMDKKIANMGYDEFLLFAKNYFRNFRLTIPPIIHQIWLGDMPPDIKNMMETFSKDYVQKNPGWRYILWDEKRLKNLNMINEDIFDKEKKCDSKSDIARLEILNRFGGWYLDSDFIWLGKHSLSFLSNAKNGFAIAYEKNGSSIGSEYLNGDSKRVANGFLGATIANPIIALLIGKLKNNYSSNLGSVKSTGPDFVQSVLNDISDLDLRILDSKYSFPVWWCCDKNRNPQYDEYKETLSMNRDELQLKYPEAIVYHKGFTSAK